MKNNAPLAAEKQICLRCCIPTLPPLQAKEDTACACDPQRMEQAVTILLDNALSYTPAGQTVALRLFCSRNKCCIQVIDTGQGIPDQEKEKIFRKIENAP